MSVLDRVTKALPPTVRGHVTPARVAALGQLVRFAAVGLVGFVADVATVYATKGAVGLIGAGMLGFAVAVNVNFAINRLWTFRNRRANPLGRQWRRYLAANLAGLLVNRGIYVVLVETVPIAAAIPLLPLFAGALAGLCLNFILSRKLVFT